MPIELAYIIILYFAIGAIAIVFINSRKKCSENKERWIKYIFYLLIVLITVYCIIHGRFRYLAIAISAMGLIEITTIVPDKKTKWAQIFATAIYLFIGAGFYGFSKWSNANVLLFVYTIVFTFDGFSQIFGQILNGKKMLPTISPQKTIAGAAGGFATAMITTFFVKDWLGIEARLAALQGVIIIAAALAGDVLASLYKRKMGIKDYSKLIPGHGGVLDRFDSFMMAGASYFFFNWILTSFVRYFIFK